MDDSKIALSVVPDNLVQKLTAIAEEWYLIHTQDIRPEKHTYKQERPSITEETED
jgi:hypothetical protein